MRFESQDFSLECDKMLQPIILSDSCPRLIVDPFKIQSLFSEVCKKKSTGPDGIPAFLLKTCAEELAPVCCPIFQQSIDPHAVPALWKRSTIIPVPKKSCPSDNNDYRPVALTSVVMKCFEKYMVSLLKSEISSELDQWHHSSNS